ncbi:MAG: tetratricopeptide repeat protein [Terriglobus roseus]|nr:tetratricopeptide repeat protein [Terriglobus roseus]
MGESAADGSDTEADSPMSDEVQSSPPQPELPPLEPEQIRLEAKELPRYLLAKSLFDCREFDRCAAVFLPGNLPRGAAASVLQRNGSAQARGKARAKARWAPDEAMLGLSHKSLFLALYAKLMSGEKRKDEDGEMVLGPADGGASVNKELAGVIAALDAMLSHLRSEERDGSGWLEYLYGVALAKNKNEELAITWLVRAVHLYPYNWGAWQELGSLLGTAEQLQALAQRLPQNIMTFIFHVHVSQELVHVTDRLHAQLDQLQALFPESPFLAAERALLHYHAKDFDEAEAIFSRLLAEHPYRLDHLDTYSNILYVMGLRPKLAFLAHTCTLADKFRPETCVVVGNYYSLLSAHEKAVVYFRRALALDRSFTAAWTLMGHEYVEMKNSHAAIESYRRAVECNRRDYRAWYGLGQTYEVLEMWSYALWYYQRAAALRPYEAKMWMAVGQCFARVGRSSNALRAYKRALVAGSAHDPAASDSGLARMAGGVLDPDILLQIAGLYDSLGQREECAAYMELCLAQEEGPQADEDSFRTSFSSAAARDARGGGGLGVTPTTSKARMWLARYEFARGEYQRAMELANELCEDGVDVEDAKALVRDIRARVEADAG